MAIAGGSADEHAQRLIDEAGAWAAGAEGERRVAAVLAEVSASWTVVHDRLLRPGRSNANLDHIAIGPAGVFLIDAKNRAGTVSEHEGGLFQHRTRDGVRETVSLAAELKKVHGMAAYMAGEIAGPVVPVLCLAGSRAEEFGQPQMVRGVWVVPVCALSDWLGARPVIVPPEFLPSLATRVVTEFPSTTTDAALLSAMAAAATAPRAGRRRTVPSAAVGQRHSPRTVAARSAPRRPRRVRRAFLIGLAVLAALAIVPQLPALFTAGVERLADTGDASTPSAPGTTTDAPTGRPTSAVAKPSANKPVPTVAAKPLGPPDCSDATAAEIRAIIHRSVKPIVTSRGCAWGTRLDDSDTQLVTIVMTEDHAAYEVELATSAKQKRVVFGRGYDTSYRPATKASIASGQLIVRGAKPVRARADTVVVVATTKLGVSDDKARAMAVAIAAAANAGR